MVELEFLGGSKTFVKVVEWIMCFVSTTLFSLPSFELKIPRGALVFLVIPCSVYLLIITVFLVVRTQSRSYVFVEMVFDFWGFWFTLAGEIILLQYTTSQWHHQILIGLYLLNTMCFAYEIFLYWAVYDPKYCPYGPGDCCERYNDE